MVLGYDTIELLDGGQGVGAERSIEQKGCLSDLPCEAHEKRLGGEIKECVKGGGPDDGP